MNVTIAITLRMLQVDGFRFDIMGHLMLSTMKKIQAALGELTLEKDGVDGKALYIYGEAWDFGEVSLQTTNPQAVIKCLLCNAFQQAKLALCSVCVGDNT